MRRGQPGLLAIASGGPYRMRFLGAYFLTTNILSAVRSLKRLSVALTKDKEP